jgi:DNA polymerase-1
VNWQNIPADLKVVRRAIVPKGDGVISSFDYSKIEPRLLAYFASKKGDDTLADYLRRGVDPYRAVIGPVYGKRHDELTEREYKDGKILFLSLVYGAGVRSVTAAFGVSKPEAKERINQFHSAWPIVRRLQDDVVRVCNRRGYIRTPWGRPLRLEQFGEHKMLNKLVQGSAAHMLKRSLIRVDRWLETQDLASHMILNVHDEIDFDGPADEVAHLHEHVPALMVEELIAPVVPILVDHEVSPTNWAEKLDYDEWKESVGNSNVAAA